MFFWMFKGMKDLDAKTAKTMAIFAFIIAGMILSALIISSF
jgi:hypothetical protein